MAVRNRAGSSVSDLQGLRVLVVEDGWQVADGLKLLLEEWGMIVDGPAATAREAQRLATECFQDLAVVDVNLRGEMAYDLMNWLHDRGTRVVVISGYEDLPKSLGKFSAILHKPFAIVTLMTTLKRVMGPRRVR